MRGLRLGLGLNGRGGGGFVPDFYVDSVSGNDSNDGSLASPYQTLTKATTEIASRGAGTKVGLLRNSVWRDKLGVATLDNIDIRVVGTGDPPQVIATDVATGWTQPDAGTYPNVWYLPNWISECINTNFAVVAFENKREMANVASLALCNSTAGSSFITTTPDGDDVIYIHATGSGNPNTNGNTYEVSKRNSVFASDTANNDGFKITGPIEAEHSPWVSGHYVGCRTVDFKQLLVKGGRRGFFSASGNIQDSIIRGSTNRQASGTSNMLVFYMSSASPGTYPGTVKRVGFLAGDQKDGSGGTYEDVAGVFSHNDQAGVTHNCTSEQCWFVDIAAMGGFRGGTHEHIAPYSKRSGCLNLESATTPAAVPVRYGMFNGGFPTAQLSSWDAVHEFEHCVSYDHKNIRTGDGFVVTNCVWWKTASANGMAMVQGVGGGVPNLSVNYSIAVTETWNFCIDMVALTSYTGDYNIFASFFTGRQARFRYNNIDTGSAGTDQYKLKRWQDLSGQDANSVYILPADQVAGGANALWLAWAEAASGTPLTSIGPAVGDFRINPNARVYGGDDTAYIGTFADGTTPITDAGPQFHWNWNTRSVVAGPPTSWPVVPETEAQSRTYIDNPGAWDFYEDVTAPTLWSPTDAADGDTAGTGSVSTNEANGTLYWVASTSSTAPTAAQVKAGNDHTGSAAADSGSQAVSAIGVQTLSPAPSGLTGSTTYYLHFMHEDAAGNQSTVSSADGFTTGASGPVELVQAGWSADAGWVENSAGNFTATSAAVNTEVEKAGILATSTSYDVTITWTGMTSGSAFRFYLLQFTTARDINFLNDGASGSVTFTATSPASGTVTALRSLNSGSNGTFTISIVETP